MTTTRRLTSLFLKAEKRLVVPWNDTQPLESPLAEHGGMGEQAGASGTPLPSAADRFSRIACIAAEQASRSARSDMRRGVAPRMRINVDRNADRRVLVAETFECASSLCHPVQTMRAGDVTDRGLPVVSPSCPVSGFARFR